MPEPDVLCLLSVLTLTTYRCQLTGSRAERAEPSLVWRTEPKFRKIILTNVAYLAPQLRQAQELLLADGPIDQEAAFVFQAMNGCAKGTNELLDAACLICRGRSCSAPAHCCGINALNGLKGPGKMCCVRNNAPQLFIFMACITCCPDLVIRNVMTVLPSGGPLMR